MRGRELEPPDRLTAAVPDAILLKGGEVLGYSKGELLGEDWFKTCLPPEQAAPVREVFDRLMAGELEPVEEYQNPVRTRSGEERLIAWHNAHRVDADGKIIGTLVYGVNVVGSEVIGLVPMEALVDAAVYYMGIENFTMEQVLEARLLETDG